MTTRLSKQHTNGPALLEEDILDERAPSKQPDEAGIDENPIVKTASAAQPDEAGVDENHADERTSATQQGMRQGTQQFVTFIAGDEVFAADMVPVKEIIRVPQVVRVPGKPSGKSFADHFASTVVRLSRFAA